MDGGGSSAPKVKPPPPAPSPDYEAELRRIALQRRQLEEKRQGRRALRLDVTRLPGLLTIPGAGIRIPEI